MTLVKIFKNVKCVCLVVFLEGKDKKSKENYRPKF